MLQEVFESLAARSKFTGRSESHLGRSAAQKLLKQVTQALPGVYPDQTRAMKQVAP